jgi:hypothetical protein
MQPAEHPAKTRDIRLRVIRASRFNDSTGLRKTIDRELNNTPRRIVDFRPIRNISFPRDIEVRSPAIGSALKINPVSQSGTPSDFEMLGKNVAIIVY